MVGERRARGAPLELLARDRAPDGVDERGGVAVAGCSRCSSHKRNRVARASAGSQVTTSTSVSLNSECSLRLAEPIASHSSSTMPILACTYSGPERSPERDRIVAARKFRGRRRRRPAGRASRACRPGRCWPGAGAARRRGSRRSADGGAWPRGLRRSRVTTGTGSRGRSGGVRCAARGRRPPAQRTRRAGARGRRPRARCG